jgi:hypothetical protein
MQWQLFAEAASVAGLSSKSQDHSLALAIAIARCAKSSTAPRFAAAPESQKSDFKWVHGEELVNFYESTPGVFRGFCRVCGSPIVNKFAAGTPLAMHDPDAPSRYGIALATLDDDPGVRPAAHVFVSSKAIWFTITDDLPQFPQFPERPTRRE